MGAPKLSISYSRNLRNRFWRYSGVMTSTRGCDSEDMSSIVLFYYYDCSLIRSVVGKSGKPAPSGPLGNQPTNASQMKSTRGLNPSLKLRSRFNKHLGVAPRLSRLDIWRSIEFCRLNRLQVQGINVSRRLDDYTFRCRLRLFSSHPPNYLLKRS